MDGSDRRKTSTDVPYILALDIGTTSIRAHIYNDQAELINQASLKIELLYPGHGRVEMDEEVIWHQAKEVIQNACAGANLSASDISCMGITTQRNTFITWDKETQKPFHHFITWQDLRSSDLVKSWNNSYRLMFLNKGAKVLHLVTRKARFLAASVLQFKSAFVTLRLAWMLQNDALLKRRMTERQVLCGCLETWLLWKFTNGKVFATDYSCASATGLFDPFQMEWSTIVSSLVGIPLHILPEIRDTSGNFGSVDPAIFGAAIPIRAVVADQQSAMFGQCCFNVGDVKLTLGTGSFIDCNTGNKPHASVAGLFPLIAWKIGDELVFTAEGFASDTGVCIEWAKQMGLFKDVNTLSTIAESVTDTGGVYFIPAFNGIQAPINDDKACTCLIGITPSTKPGHIIKAVMDSLAFRFKLLYDTVLLETKTKLSSTIKCDGGVSQNDYLMGLIADLTGCTIDRPQYIDTTSLGAAFLAGLAQGIWKNKQQLQDIRLTQRLFTPNKVNSERYTDILEQWLKAMKRAKNWYM